MLNGSQIDFPAKPIIIRGDISRIYGTATPTATERTYANTFSYTPDGRIEKLRLGNGLWEKATFNSRLQVTEMAVGMPPTEPNSSYAPAGDDSAGPLWTHLKYDWIGRVVRKINTDGIDQTTLNDSDVLISYEDCGLTAS